MKRPKDRLYRVTVIGATPAGVAATSTLGNLGVPVTLVGSSADLDKELSGNEFRLKSGIQVNHAHRPELIRMLRKPDINCIMPAEIKSIKHNSQGFQVSLIKHQTFVNPDRCTLCGRCVDICPVSDSMGEKAIRFNSKQSLPASTIIDKRIEPPCQANCPLGVNAQGYITLAGKGRYKEALTLIREDNVLPGICGRVCTHPCEENCRRGEIDEPIAIRDIKRFVTDCQRIGHTHKKESVVLDKKAKKIAVIGSGPTGLAAASDLARYGYQVTVFEKEKMPGGLLRFGIGPHRLPRNIIDTDIEYIENLGVKIITSHPVDLSNDLDRLGKDFDAVILSTGTWSDRGLGVPGESFKGVEGCLTFLGRVHRDEIKELREKVAVIGDGNAAFDLARHLVRMRADVTLVSWFPEKLIPADPDEIEASQKEGISIIDSTRVVAFLGQNGKIDTLRCMPTRLGKPDENGICWPVTIKAGKSFDLKFDRALVAIGQAGVFKDKKSKLDFNVTRHGFIKVDKSMQTNLFRVYAAGDAVSGPTSVVEAMESGRKTARIVHADISKKQPLNTQLNDQFNIRPLRPKDKNYPEIDPDIAKAPRSLMPETDPLIRCKDFSEVAFGLSESQIALETARCLQCGACSQCLMCVEACGSISAINHSELPEEITERTGVVIIADSKMGFHAKGEDVIRAYGPKASVPDVHAMILRGFASASRAMILLGSVSHRSRGHGVSFSPPDPGLSPDIRLGIFVCRCNDAFGWLDEMSEHIEKLIFEKNIAHVEIMASACVPEGSAHIIQTVREKGITRVVLASCVCCPLNFVCAACTDQRHRLKEALFNGTGLSRSILEACNLKGEVLRLIKQDRSLALSRFVGLIERSIKRSKKLKPLPAPYRNYNFTTAVIGESEATISSALTLADAGLEVFFFGSSEKPLTKALNHSNIHSFTGSSVKNLSGTLGDFQVLIELNNFVHNIQVGAVILGEKSRKKIQYIHQKGLPSRIVASAMQKKGVSGIPLFYPGATSIDGLYLADPVGINLSNRKKGAAAAAQAAAIMPQRPRQSKGYTVVVDESLCRSCGRCISVCPYQAITLHKNNFDGWCASVDEALCKGCGNCISICPTTAADSPYRDQNYLEQALEELLEQ